MDSDLPNWESIVRTHGPMAFDTAWRILGHTADTEDVVQDALLDAFRLHGHNPVKNWGALLRHLTTRRAIDRLRKRRFARSLSNDPAASDPPSPQSEQPESAAEQQELADRLRRALARLSAREAGVFSLRHFGELSNTEIAETMKISADAVGIALHKARKKLKELLGQPETAGRRTRP